MWRSPCCVSAVVYIIIRQHTRSYEPPNEKTQLHPLRNLAKNTTTATATATATAAATTTIMLLLIMMEPDSGLNSRYDYQFTENTESKETC